MRLEDLTHSQMILLTVLVSFITSIATGILTNSLINSNDPQDVSRSINQVVERTIEKVVPQTIIQTITKEVAVPTNEGEKIVTAINKVSPAIFKLFTDKNDGTELALESGIVLADRGLFITTTKNISRDSVYWLKFDKDTKLKMSLALLDPEKGLVVFKLTGLDAQLKTIPNLGIAKAVVVGQTVVSLGANDGADNRPLSVGILLSAGGNNATSTNPSFFRTNAANADTLGGPVLNIDGELVGLVVGPGIILSVNSVSTLIDSLK